MSRETWGGVATRGGCGEDGRGSSIRGAGVGVDRGCARRHGRWIGKGRRAMGAPADRPAALRSCRVLGLAGDCRGSFFGTDSAGAFLMLLKNAVQGLKMQGGVPAECMTRTVPRRSNALAKRPFAVRCGGHEGGAGVPPAESGKKNELLLTPAKPRAGQERSAAAQSAGAPIARRPFPLRRQVLTGAAPVHSNPRPLFSPDSDRGRPALGRKRWRLQLAP